MGEANYYMKADNCTEKTLEEVREFFHEGVNAQDWWQEHRDYELQGKRDQFWSEFEVAFPMVTKYAKCIRIFGGDCHNTPVGKLDFGSAWEMDDNLELKGYTLYYYANVWHFADWDGLMIFLWDEFALLNGRWISDEYINPFDLLE